MHLRVVCANVGGGRGPGGSQCWPGAGTKAVHVAIGPWAACQFGGVSSLHSDVAPTD